ncbi:protein LiaH [Cytophagales bacterium WSM2-2]|nr:protein LiaH [Cytophagales bacterium WSM2-2]
MWLRIFQRLANIFKAKAYKAVDQLENPVEMSRLAVAELEKSISDAAEAFSIAVANHKKWDRELQQASLASENWKQKAKMAIAQSNEELAKKALTEKSNEDRKVMEYTAIFQKSEKDNQLLKQNLESLQLKLKEMRSKQSVLEAKAKNAEAQGKIAKQLSGIGTSALSNFQRYEEKINEMADQSEALQESLFAQKSLEREFDQLEGNVTVSTELESLKQEMQSEELEKKEQMEQRKLEKLKIKLDTQSAPVQPAKQIGSNKDAKLKHFFGEK